MHTPHIHSAEAPQTELDISKLRDQFGKWLSQMLEAFIQSRDTSHQTEDKNASESNGFSQENAKSFIRALIDCLDVLETILKNKKNSDFRSELREFLKNIQENLFIPQDVFSWGRNQIASDKFLTIHEGVLPIKEHIISYIPAILSLIWVSPIPLWLDWANDATIIKVALARSSVLIGKTLLTLKEAREAKWNVEKFNGHQEPHPTSFEEVRNIYTAKSDMEDLENSRASVLQEISSIYFDTPREDENYSPVSLGWEVRKIAKNIFLHCPHPFFASVRRYSNLLKQKDILEQSIYQLQYEDSIQKKKKRRLDKTGLTEAQLKEQLESLCINLSLFRAWKKDTIAFLWKHEFEERPFTDAEKTILELQEDHLESKEDIIQATILYIEKLISPLFQVYFETYPVMERLQRDYVNTQQSAKECIVDIHNAETTEEITQARKRLSREMQEITRLQNQITNLGTKIPKISFRSLNGKNFPNGKSWQQLKQSTEWSVNEKVESILKTPQV